MMRVYLIAQGIAAAVQCLLVWLVVVVTDRKLAREWGANPRAVEGRRDKAKPGGRRASSHRSSAG